MEEDNLSEVSDIFDDKEIRSPIIQRLLDRIEYLEINQEMLINDNDRQKLLNSSFEEKNNELLFVNSYFNTCCE